MGKKTTLAVAILAIAFIGEIGDSTAAAQSGNYDAVALRTGFTPDPHVVSGVSGGSANASNTNASCRGWIASNPDHVFTANSDFSFLRIFAQSSGDTTLVIQTPNGQMRCNDDTYGHNPMVEGRFPRGTYRIWIGSYSQGENLRYRLSFTELQSETGAGAGGANNNNQNQNQNSGGGDADRGLQIDSTQGNFTAVNLRTGFTPDPHRTNGVSGGQLNATRLGNECRGWIAGRPDHIVRLRSNFNFFRIFVNSDSDTTLVVRLPNGRFVCNDDARGLNPAVDRDRWRRGLYRVWVGSYSEGDNSRYEIGFTELRNRNQ